MLLFVIIGDCVVKGIKQGVHMLFVFIANGAVFSEVLFFSVRVVCFVSFLQGWVVAKQIIGCDVEMAGDTQKFVLADGAISFLDTTQNALMDPQNVC